MFPCAVQAQKARPPDLLRQLGVTGPSGHPLCQLAPLRAAPVLPGTAAGGAAIPRQLLLEWHGRAQWHILPARLPVQVLQLYTE